MILRDNTPFGEVGRGEFGTYFIGYARTPTVTERMLQRMFLGARGGPDRCSRGLTHPLRPELP